MSNISNHLLFLHYDPEVTPQQLIDEHRAFGAEFPDVPRPPRRPSADGKIRVGYVSPDFRAHACACFLDPLITAHDRTLFEIYCYSSKAETVGDHVAEHFKSIAQWRSIAGLDDDTVRAMIAADGIDVLVDCAGHTAGKRITLFAQRPAPMSVTYLGYPDTTGLRQIDYRITDAVADPRDEGNNFAVEELVRLPRGFLTYDPLAETPLPSPPPYLRNGYITFGCFNNRSKVNDDMLALWGRILREVPNSRLLLKDKRWTGRPFLGVSPERVQLAAFAPTQSQHFAAYGAVDIALDAFPYNGTTTTCDALWMGVPVVALRGKHHAARVSASLLTCVGRQDLIAETPDEYVAKAVSLAQDTQALAQHRAEARQAFLASPLGNANMLARDMEAFFIQALARMGSQG
ncbi:MAG: hypothetical protein JNM81_10420 [Rhodospirillaceae bacterium]|nr:hypothetical protein [Rhodospirillaceae bacterium]